MDHGDAKYPSSMQMAFGQDFNHSPVLDSRYKRKNMTDYAAMVISYESSKLYYSISYVEVCIELVFMAASSCIIKRDHWIFRNKLYL